MKKITLEKLAVMIQKGFEDVLETTAKKADLEAFRDEIKEEITSIREEIMSIRTRLDAIEKKLDNVVDQAEFYQLKTRVDNLEKRILSLKK